jgi:hypothetical protein
MGEACDYTSLTFHHIHFDEKSLGNLLFPAARLFPVKKGCGRSRRGAGQTSAAQHSLGTVIATMVAARALHALLAAK